jgi:hypothetical protein
VVSARRAAIRNGAGETRRAPARRPSGGEGREELAEEAVAAIRAKLDRQQAELDTWERVAAGTGFASGG